MGASLLDFYGALLCAWGLKSCWKLMKLILLNAQAILLSRIQFSKSVKYFSDCDLNQLVGPGGYRSGGMNGSR